MEESSDSPTLLGRRQLLKGALLSAAGAAGLARLLGAQESTANPPKGNASAIEEVTISHLRQELDSGRLTARSLAEQYLSRIAAIDKAGPGLNSVIELNPDALAIAGRSDEELRAKKPRGPLHGIPVLLKDNIATADRMQTTAGSLALVGSRPPKDSFVAARLRAAGAVILGKTNLSEWANFRGDHSTSGWSARGGQTRNPYALDRNPSGSSSGSGVAVAANLCAVAVGTETDGSIVSPSSINGIVGIKPTVGLVSRSGIVPISHTQDTAGPMARTVADAAALLGVLAGLDGEDPASEVATGHLEKDYTRFCDAKGLRGARLGVVRKLAGFNRQVDGLLEEALGAMKQAGAEIVDPVAIASIGKVDEPELQVLLFEFKADVNRYLASLGSSAPVRSVEEVIEFNRKNRDRELVHFGQELLEKSAAKGDLNSEEYKKALADCRRLSRAEGIDLVMDRPKLDALVAPTESPAWPTDTILGDHFLGGASTLPAVAGYPHITVPMGFVSGLPVGISFFGRPWSEPALIRIAYAYEQATKCRRQPQFRAAAVRQRATDSRWAFR